MSRKITNGILQRRVEQLNKTLGRPLGTQEPGNIQVAYGRCRLIELTEDGGERELSEPGTNAETYRIVSAMLSGIQLEQKRSKE